MLRTRMTDVLLSWRKIDADTLGKAVALQPRLGRRIGEVLVEMGAVRRTDVLFALAAQAGLRVVDLTQVRPDAPALAAVSRGTALRLQALPLRIGGHDGATLAVAVGAPVDLAALDHLRAVTGRKVEPFLADETTLAVAIERAYGEVPAEVEIDLDDDDELELETLPLAASLTGG